MTITGITGVLGHSWRADVTAWGAIAPWDGSAVLDWHVAAEDRWHSPAGAAVRQHRLAGTPVFETRLHVPGGDVVQRLWSVADAGGCTVVEVANDSPLPVAGAFTRPDVATSRPPADVPVNGIDVPAGTVVLPISHHAAVRIALLHRRGGSPRLHGGLADAEATARGWAALAGRASRVLVPDTGWVEAAVGARCDLLLAGLPGGEDPAEFLLAAGELVRMGEIGPADAQDIAGDVGIAAEAVARCAGWDVDAALDAAGLVLAAAGERRAVDDLVRITDARRPARPPAPPVSGIRAVAALERRLARGPVLLPDGIPAAWRGAEIEAHGLAAGPATTLSFAVRWHGEHPAVLWETSGASVELSAPAVDPTWRSSAPSGEALWRSTGR